MHLDDIGSTKQFL